MTEKWNIPQWLACHFLKAKGRKNKQELKTAAGLAWQSITREEDQHLVTSMGSRHQGLFNQVLKLTIKFMIAVL